MRKVRSVALLAVVATLGCRDRVPPSSGLVSVTPAIPVQPSHAETGCGSNASLSWRSARVGIAQISRVAPTGPRSPGSWRDLEISGGASDLDHVCSVLVIRELATTFPAETQLETYLLRACAEEPLPPPPVQKAIRLVTRRALQSADLLLQGVSASCVSPKTKAVLVDTTPYEDRASCEVMLARIEAATRKAEASALDPVNDWLDGQIKRSTALADEACSEGESADCTTRRRMVELLRERKKMVPALAGEAREAVSTCEP